MNITEVRIKKVDAGALKAFATVTIDGAFAVHGVKVIESKDKTFVAMPSRRARGGGDRPRYLDIAHPVSREARKIIEDAVLAQWAEGEDAKPAEPADTAPEA